MFSFFYHYTLVLLPCFFLKPNFFFYIMLLSCKKDALWILWYVKIVLVM